MRELSELLDQCEECFDKISDEERENNRPLNDAIEGLCDSLAEKVEEAQSINFDSICDKTRCELLNVWRLVSAGEKLKNPKLLVHFNALQATVAYFKNGGRLMDENLDDDECDGQDKLEDDDWSPSSRKAWRDEDFYEDEAEGAYEDCEEEYGCECSSCAVDDEDFDEEECD